MQAVSDHLRPAAAAPAPEAAITLGDLAGRAAAGTFPLPHDRLTVLLFVAGDCPVCGEIWQVVSAVATHFGQLAGCAAHVVSQDPELSPETAMNRRQAQPWAPLHSCQPALLVPTQLVRHVACECE